MAGGSSGTNSVNTDPSPTVEDTSMRPPSMRASSLEIDSPSPVPPYLRLVVPSACWNASKIISSLPAGMPMPVSRTANAMNPALSAPDRLTCRVTPPVSVNFTALANRLRNTCWSRWESVVSVEGTSAPISTVSVSPFSSACGPSACSRSPQHLDQHDRSGVEIGPPGLDLGEVEDVVDEP